LDVGGFWRKALISMNNLPLGLRLLIPLSALLAVLLVGCGAEAAPVIVSPIPTTPSIETPTPIPRTPTPTSTLFIPPTITLAPTQVSQSGAAPTSPLQATFTSAPATQTSAFQPEFAGVEVEYFITNQPGPFAAGDRLTLFWRINGAPNGRIFRIDAEGNRLQVWDVASEGRLTVGLEAEEGETLARFLMRAEINGNFSERTLELSLGCPFSWFFLPAPEGCPLGVPESTGQVQQNFEGGSMFWLASSQQIYILYNDDASPTWQVFDDTFEEGMPPQDDSLVPPPDLLQPVRGFGLVWRDNPTIRERLGWAVEPELGYDGIIQSSEDRLYLRERGGGIVALQTDGQLWEVLPDSAENIDALVQATAEVTSEVPTPQ
jgi:hypothetical protein